MSIFDKQKMETSQTPKGWRKIITFKKDGYELLVSEDGKTVYDEIYNGKTIDPDCIKWNEHVKACQEVNISPQQSMFSCRALTLDEALQIVANHALKLEVKTEMEKEYGLKKCDH